MAKFITMLNHGFGKASPPAMIYGGYVFMAIGAFNFLMFNFIGGAISLIIGLLISFPTKGVLIDTEKKMYKHYTNYFGWKQGAWKSYENLPHLSILKRRTGTKTYSHANVEMTDVDTFYDIFLLSESHRTKVLIKRLKQGDDAKEMSHLLAEELEVEWVKYNPVVSAKTRARRR